MVRAGLRRIFVILAVVLGGTAAISSVLGALAGSSILHALATGYYLAGAAVLFGSLALGSRGPTRVDRSGEEDQPVAVGGFLGVGRRPLGRRNRRKATPEERSEARWASLGLFALGLLLVLVGATLDPARRIF